MFANLQISSKTLANVLPEYIYCVARALIALIGNMTSQLYVPSREEKKIF